MQRNYSVGVIYGKNFSAKNNIAKADFCRLGLGTFLDRIAGRHDINETRNTVISHYNISTAICQIECKELSYS